MCNIKTGGPGKTAMTKPFAREAVLAVRFQDLRDAMLIALRRGRGKGERHFAKPEFEQAVALPGLAVVVALGPRAAQDRDLPGIEPEAFVDAGNLRFERPVVGQEDPGRTAFYDGAGDTGILDIGEALGREDDARVLLAQRLEPLPELGGKGRAVEDQPAFVDYDQRRAAVEPSLDPVKEIGEYGARRARANKAFRLEDLNAGTAKPLFLGIEQLSPRSAQAPGEERRLELL